MINLATLCMWVCRAIDKTAEAFATSIAVCVLLAYLRGVCQKVCDFCRMSLFIFHTSFAISQMTPTGEYADLIKASKFATSFLKAVGKAAGKTFSPSEFCRNVSTYKKLIAERVKNFLPTGPREMDTAGLVAWLMSIGATSRILIQTAGMTEEQKAAENDRILREEQESDERARNEFQKLMKRTAEESVAHEKEADEEYVPPKKSRAERLALRSAASDVPAPSTDVLALPAPSTDVLALPAPSTDVLALPAPLEHQESQASATALLADMTTNDAAEDTSGTARFGVYNHPHATDSSTYLTDPSLLLALLPVLNDRHTFGTAWEPCKTTHHVSTASCH